MKTITLIKPDKILKGVLALPSSKSISNRLLILRAFSGKWFNIENLSDADDTLLLLKLLEKIEAGRSKNSLIELDTANAGTVMRFLTAFLSLMPGKWILTGNDRMKQRPIGILVDALKTLGADIEYLSKIGYPPLLIKGRPLQGGQVIVDPGISSQFVSALMLVGPQISGGLSIILKGQAVSFPYIEMTANLLQYFGVAVEKNKNLITIPQSEIKPLDYVVEADWSSAAFWYEASALSEETDILLVGLQKNSIQGDAILSGIYKNFGILTEYSEEGIYLKKSRKKIDGYYFDFSDYPDIAPAVITTCAALGIRGRFEGLKSLKIKETNRLKALRAELEKLGVRLEPEMMTEMIPKIEFTPSILTSYPDLRIETYGDHRMAMTFAPLALKLGRIRIENPDVVSKSYPQFWEHLVSVGFEIV